jgi:hypothetical protein
MIEMIETGTSAEADAGTDAAKRIEALQAHVDEMQVESTKWIASLERYLAAAKAEGERRELLRSEVRRRRRGFEARLRDLRAAGKGGTADALEVTFAAALDRFVAAALLTDGLAGPTRTAPRLARVSDAGQPVGPPDPFEGLEHPGEPFESGERGGGRTKETR